MLGDTVDAVIDRIQNGDLPGAGAHRQVLGPMVKQGRLKLQTVDPAGEQFLTRIHAGGAFPRARRLRRLVTQNAAGNKIELFLHRSLRTTCGRPRDRHREGGRHHHPAQRRARERVARLRDRRLRADPTPPGHYRGFVSFYTPLALQAATADGNRSRSRPRRSSDAT